MGPKVREHMTDRPRCVTPETPVTEAAELMASEDVGSLPILDGDELIGVITDRDIVVRAVAKRKNPQGLTQSRASGGLRQLRCQFPGRSALLGIGVLGVGS